MYVQYLIKTKMMFFGWGTTVFMRLSVCGHCVTTVHGGKIFSEEQVFKTTDISRLQLSNRSRVSSCRMGKKGQFICINAKYINQTKQKHKAVVLELHPSNNIISRHFLCLKLLLISESVELNIT